MLLRGEEGLRKHLDFSLGLFAHELFCWRQQKFFLAEKYLNVVDDIFTCFIDFTLYVYIPQKLYFCSKNNSASLTQSWTLNSGTDFLEKAASETLSLLQQLTLCVLTSLWVCRSKVYLSIIKCILSQSSMHNSHKHIMEERDTQATLVLRLF